MLRILGVCNTFAEGPCLDSTTHVAYNWLKDAYNYVSSSGHHRDVNIPVYRSTAYKMLNDFAKILFYSFWQLWHSWKVCFLKMKIPYQPQFSPYNFCLPSHFLRSPMSWKNSKANKTFSSIRWNCVVDKYLWTLILSHLAFETIPMPFISKFPVWTVGVCIGLLVLYAYPKCVSHSICPN